MSLTKVGVLLGTVISNSSAAENGATALFFTVRNEFYDDKVGSRTGHATSYSEHSIGITWWPDKIVTLRPDHSYDTAAFENGAQRNQFVASMDFIIHY